MKNKRNIIESQYPPQNQNDLWFKNGILYYNAGKDWIEINQNMADQQSKSIQMNIDRGFEFATNINTKNPIVSTTEYNYTVPGNLTTLSVKHTEPSEGDPVTSIVTLHTAGPHIYNPGDYILVQWTYGYEPDGITLSEDWLVLYVDDVSNDGYDLEVLAVNGKKINDVFTVPSISRGTVLIRMGNSYQRNFIPDKQYLIDNPQYFFDPSVESYNICQYFNKTLIEDSSKINGIINENTETNEQENRLIQKFIIDRNMSLLFGEYHLYDEQIEGDLPNLCNGIWYQAGKEYAYGDDGFTEETLIDLLREAFTGDVIHSDFKILLCGSELAGYLMQRLGNSYIYKSTLGTIYVICNEIFDYAGKESCGIVIDPMYFKKYITTPFSGKIYTNESDDKVLLLEEECCMVLENRKAHMRIIKM